MSSNEFTNFWFDTIKENNRSYVVRVRWKQNGKVKEKQKSFPKSRYTKSEVKNVIKEIEVNSTKLNKDEMVYNPFEYVSDDPNLTIGMAVQSYLNNHKESLSDQTYSAYNSVLQNFIDANGEHILCKQLKFEDFKNFVDDRCTTLKSKNSYMTPFKNLYNYLEREYNYSYKPTFHTIGTRREKRKEKNEKKVIITEDELWELVKASLQEYDKECDIKDIYSFVIYFYIGMRTEELSWIKVRDVDIQNRKIYIGRNKDTKTYSQRTIWLPDETHNIFELLMDDKEMNDYLYDHSRMDGKGRLMRSASYKYQRMYEKVFPKRDKMVMYNLRHSCGCWLLEQKYSIMFVRDQLGHANLDQVLEYVKLTGVNQENEIQKYYENNSPKKVNRFEQIMSHINK